MTRLIPPLRYVSAKDSSWAFRAICIAGLTAVRVYSVPRGWHGSPRRMFARGRARIATLQGLSDRWLARRSLGGDASVWVASGLLFLAVAAFVLGGSREAGLGLVLTW